MNQSEVYICFLPPEALTHLSLHSTTLGPYRTPVGLSSLSHIANSQWLSVLHMAMYVSMLLSPHIPPSPSSQTAQHVHKSVLYVCVSTARQTFFFKAFYFLLGYS